VGTFAVEVGIGDPARQRWDTVKALVDTGSTYTWVPRDTLTRLGVQPRFARPFVTADGRRVEREMASTFARLEGQELPTLVVFSEPGTQPLLGMYTLEGFGLGVDSVNQRLVPVPGRP
jgi:clan AA aspartic protease